MATDFASAARKAFLTVVRQERSCAVSAEALEAVTVKAARATTAKIIINFQTGLSTPGRVIGLPS
ncbi:MAG: hypothetical protein ACTHK6_06100 [Solirubrobacterales bacterium]